jgi:hypothetical protein
VGILERHTFDTKFAVGEYLVILELGYLPIVADALSTEGESKKAQLLAGLGFTFSIVEVATLCKRADHSMYAK